ncbi:tRNA (adenosine(37)-N6)-threonylcarbamoyltransferase complex ATPase subunit type 1 TsaE [Spiroplasma endosymbiont of Amphibalanus improvisus]|uniref:tRNA (adenosine(37)-N6)-threonylcarbamoyltransferase complex ATPase subunit type 1 TsaE n=1 Tax=Spiroplasma endosymbiont of Amphibalanus improvisus TaxID=3066327 RepID=UPI00313A9E49
MNKKIKSNNLQDTEILAEFVFNKLNVSEIKYKQYFILLNGPIGSGKTTFTKMLLKQFNYDKNVSSPTFNIHHQYKVNGILINHFDFYRLQDSCQKDELESFLELCYNSINIIEWPENILANLITDKSNIIFNIKFSIINENNRIIEFSEI